MILTIVAILVLLWLLGLITHIGALVNILLVAALVVFIWDRLASRNRA